MEAPIPYLDNHWDKSKFFDPESSLPFYQNSEHPRGHVIEMVTSGAIRRDDLKIISPKATEKFGQSTERVLAEIGFPLEEIASLEKRQIVSKSQGKRYIPL